MVKGKKSHSPSSDFCKDLILSLNYLFMYDSRQFDGGRDAYGRDAFGRDRDMFGRDERKRNRYDEGICSWELRLVLKMNKNGKVLSLYLENL